MTTISLLGSLVAVFILATGWWVYRESFADFSEPIPVVYHEANLNPEDHYPVVIIGHPEIPKVYADVATHTGEEAMVSCSVCHTTRTPDLSNRSAETLDEFHQGLSYAHGQLSCLSCHNQDNYDTLRLADGSPVEFTETMRLCAQCHGPQYRDYQNGSHGGMVGYWDLSRGPRIRNACTVCHDPHAPAYPQLIPVFPPRDLSSPDNSHETQAH